MIPCGVYKIYRYLPPCFVQIKVYELWGGKGGMHIYTLDSIQCSLVKHVAFVSEINKSMIH